MDDEKPLEGTLDEQHSDQHVAHQQYDHFETTFSNNRNMTKMKIKNVLLCITVRNSHRTKDHKFARVCRSVYECVTSRTSTTVDSKLFTGDVFLIFFTGISHFSPGYNAKNIFPNLTLKMAGDFERGSLLVKISTGGHPRLLVF